MPSLHYSCDNVLKNSQKWEMRCECFRQSVFLAISIHSICIWWSATTSKSISFMHIYSFGISGKLVTRIIQHCLYHADSNSILCKVSPFWRAISKKRLHKFWFWHSKSSSIFTFFGVSSLFLVCCCCCCCCSSEQISSCIEIGNGRDYFEENFISIWVIMIKSCCFERRHTWNCLQSSMFQ